MRLIRRKKKASFFSCCCDSTSQNISDFINALSSNEYVSESDKLKILLHFRRHFKERFIGREINGSFRKIDSVFQMIKEKVMFKVMDSGLAINNDDLFLDLLRYTTDFKSYVEKWENNSGSIVKFSMSRSGIVDALKRRGLAVYGF